MFNKSNEGKLIMKRLIIVPLAATAILSGCAHTTNLSKEGQAGIGAGLGGALGAAIGYAVCGAECAAIGAGAGIVAGGLTAYALASDPYTQSAAQQAESWKKETGSEAEVVKVSDVTENGQKRQRLDVQKMQLSDAQVVTKDRLSPRIKEQLINTKSSALKTGGYVHVVCPANAPSSVMSDIDKIGIGYSKDTTTASGYTIYLSRDRAELKSLNI